MQDLYKQSEIGKIIFLNIIDHGLDRLPQII
jgi:hypothetical protein